MIFSQSKQVCYDGDLPVRGANRNCEQNRLRGEMVENSTSSNGVHYWEHLEKKRYYLLYFEKDLFGDQILVRRWGSLCSKRGGERKTLVSSDAPIDQLMSDVRKRRASRGYICLNG